MSRLKNKLKSGELALGMGHFSGCASFVEIAGAAGFDFVYIDMHQAPLSFETVQSMVIAADASGVSPLVRVAEFNPTWINLAINSGAEGVIVPHVSSYEMAKEIVDASRYPPRGHRGACPSIRGARYSATPWKQYLDRSDKETLLVLLLEDESGFNDIDRIASIEGVDILLLGPFDLSQELGIPDGNWRHPLMKRHLQSAVKAGIKSGVKIWTTTTSYMEADYVKELEDSGVAMISYCTEEVIFYQACRKLVVERGFESERREDYVESL